MRSTVHFFVIFLEQKNTLLCFFKVSTKVPAGYTLYGFGEKHTLEFGWSVAPGERKRKTIWSAGQPVIPDANLYGHQTFSLGISASGRSYGIWLLNSNALEVEIFDQPSLDKNY